MSLLPVTRIQTARFLMRSLVEADATDGYRAWFSDPEIRRHIQYAREKVTLPGLRKYIADRATRDDVLFLGIFDQDTGIHIGNVKFEPIDQRRSLAVLGVLIGAREWRNRGVAQETIPPACAWVRANHGVSRFLLGVARDNRPAAAAYERIGFRTTDDFPDIVHGSTALTMVWEPT